MSEDIEIEDVINFNDEEDYSEMDIEGTLKKYFKCPKVGHLPQMLNSEKRAGKRIKVNVIGRYSREFNQQGTSIVLETFKAVSSPNEEN
ncbi:31694_t:CDS:2, partial [Racocetra persica]